MKHKSLLILLLALLTSTALHAYDAYIYGIYYNFSGDEAIVTYSDDYHYSGNVVIPASVIYKEKTYSVTCIADSAFYKCSSLTSVTIPNSVTSIGDSAFNGCSGLKEIYCYAEETPEVGSWCFNGVKKSKVLLVVPDDAVEKYKAHEVWGKFMIETATNIKEIENGELLRQRLTEGKKVESSDEEWYDLSGRKLDKPQRGINIIRYADGTSKKLIRK